MKYLVSISVLSLLFINVKAQKLPDVQQTSMRANTREVKIDGRLNEWGHQLNVYNNATEIRYSIANSEDYLYLAIQATDIEIIDKIIRSSLAFTINTDGSKKERKGIMFTYPAFPKGKSSPFLGLYKIKDIRRDKDNATIRTDSLINASNDAIKNQFKFISAVGLKTDTTELLSIYNQEGISVASRFDGSLYYSIELAIPLKLLKGATKFSYNIQINGYAYNGTNLQAIRDRFLGYTGADGQNYMLGEPTPRNWSLATPSSFWGDYTLVK